MTHRATTIRITVIALTALLALPLAQTASPVEAKRRPRTVNRMFDNTTRIDLLVSETEPVSGSLYPSPIAVTGVKGKIRDVNLTLDGLTHSFPDQVEVLLVGPRGQTAIVLADVGAAPTSTP